MLVACVFKGVTADTGPLARTVDKELIIGSYGHNYTEIGFTNSGAYGMPILCQQTRNRNTFCIRMSSVRSAER